MTGSGARLAEALERVLDHAGTEDAVQAARAMDDAVTLMRAVDAEGEQLPREDLARLSVLHARCVDAVHQMGRSLEHARTRLSDARRARRAYRKSG